MTRSPAFYRTRTAVRAGVLVLEGIGLAAAMFLAMLLFIAAGSADVVLH